jgi:hypothetical protein
MLMVGEIKAITLRTLASPSTDVVGEMGMLRQSCSALGFPAYHVSDVPLPIRRFVDLPPHRWTGADTATNVS